MRKQEENTAAEGITRVRADNQSCSGHVQAMHVARVEKVPVMSSRPCAGLAANGFFVEHVQISTKCSRKLFDNSAPKMLFRFLTWCVEND
eukprot:scaffold5345_cov86-Cylindrotheca_fusiformis.AAC.7